MTSRVICNKYDNHERFAELFNSTPEKDKPVVETVADIKHKLPYQVGAEILKFSEHIGQRKLFLNELQFLTKYQAKYCIYAGAAPGNKTHHLASFFPNMKFILIDPNRFNLLINKNDTLISHRALNRPDIIHLSAKYPLKYGHKHAKDIVGTIKSTNYRIYILEDFMTDDMARLLKGLDHVFISDVRSNVCNKTYPTDYDIYWNSAMMYNWMNILQSKASMLKTRMPYGTDVDKKSETNDEFETAKRFGIDFLGDYTVNRFRMPRGQLMIQPWAGQSSTEVRLVIEKKNISNVIEYDVKDIEDKLYYYNNIERMWDHHVNPNSSKVIGFCHCNDCALENKIWTDYGIQDVHKECNALGILTNRPLSNYHRFMIFDEEKNKLISDRVGAWAPTKRIRFRSQIGNAGK